MAKKFKEAGYEIDLSLMSVPKLESYGSTLLRYATDLIYNNSPRWVPKEVHDESYEKFIVTLKELYKKGLVNKSEVYMRSNNNENEDPIKIYSSQEKQFRDPIEAILYGREKGRKDAIEHYESMHDIVYRVFFDKAPNLLVKLKSWEELYKEEKQGIDNREICK